MYLRPHDLLVLTAAGLAPPSQLTPRDALPGARHHATPTGEVVRLQRRRRSAALRRLLGRVLLRSGIRLLRSARRAGRDLHRPVLQEAA